MEYLEDKYTTHRYGHGVFFFLTPQRTPAMSTRRFDRLPCCRGAKCTEHFDIMWYKMLVGELQNDLYSKATHIVSLFEKY